MSKSNVVDLSGRDADRDEPTELIRKGARQLICQALEAEVSELLTGFSGEQDARGRAAVVRNSYQPQREIQTGIGPVSVKVPKVRSRSGEPDGHFSRRRGWGHLETRCCVALRPNFFSWAHMDPGCADGPGAGETDMGATDPPVPPLELGGAVGASTSQILDTVQNWAHNAIMSMQPSIDAASLLRDHGVQVTAQRLAVLRAVSGRPHGTADDVAEVVRSEIGAISRQAVY
ncbi:MAG: hypothetical protein V3R62_10600, partial [Acidiferrobacterales bacterium]